MQKSNEYLNVATTAHTSVGKALLKTVAACALFAVAHVEESKAHNATSAKSAIVSKLHLETDGGKSKFYDIAATSVRYAGKRIDAIRQLAESCKTANEAVNTLAESIADEFGNFDGLKRFLFTVKAKQETTVVDRIVSAVNKLDDYADLLRVRDAILTKLDSFAESDKATGTNG